MTPQKKIVFLAADCESSRWVYNALKTDFHFTDIILEKPLSKRMLFRRRIKKIGLLKTAGQALFSILAVPFLKWKAKKRRESLISKYNLLNTPFPVNSIRTDNINCSACKQSLQTIQPDIVLVNGTRIISRTILQCTSAVFINMHLGITPYYRGSHGGYWALYNKDADNFGTTVHLVDTGIDTGGVLTQAFAIPGKEDNFTTYPVIQAAIGIEALKKTLPDVLHNRYNIKKNSEQGKMYHQPAIWEYFMNNTK